MQLVQDFLEKAAEARPEKVALITEGKRWTYRQIEEMANRVANGLTALGVRRGDRVAVQLPNGVEAVAAIFGILKAGGVFVPVNRGTKVDKLAYILNNCAAVSLVGDARLFPGGRADGLFEAIPSLASVVGCGPGLVESGPVRRCLAFDTLQAESPATRPARCNIDLDLACLIYTSGTTGDAKGVMSDHSNVVFASGSIIEYLGNTDRDVVINVLPLSFDYGLYQLLMSFRFQGTLVLENSFAYPAAILKRIQDEGVTGLPGVPTLFAMLLPLDLSGYDLSRLRYVTNTAAALPVSHVEALRRKFPGARLFSMYGLTETKRTLYLPPEHLARKPGSVGVAIPGTEAFVVDEQGRRLGPGEVGQLVARGRHVMRGYWNAPQATAERFRSGTIPGERWCYTGDLFRTDEEGFFFFVGRSDDIIKSRGEKVAPKEVENALHAMPGIAEAAVVGAEDPVLGQAVVAFVVRSDPQLTAQRVLAHCKARLEDFMVPARVEFVESLPKTESGKVHRRALKDAVSKPAREG